jgi:6-phosphogluconate dehydrogenase
MYRAGESCIFDDVREREKHMQLGMIGLGRMGGNIVRRLLKAGHSCVVYDKSPAAVQELAGEGAKPGHDLAGFVKELTPPRAVWVMLPAGEITHATIVELSGLLAAGDILIDGGNSFFQDDIRHAELLRAKDIRFVDVGTSGGVWGLERGYCMMIGGDKSVVDHLDPIFKTLAPGIGNIDRTPGRQGRDARAEQGYLHCGPPGAGHFVKMVHNGIEYGVMQAYAEGFDILRNVSSAAVPENRRYRLDLPDIAEVWRRGSVISSWLLDLTAIALAADSELEAFTGQVADSGEGRWTVQAAIEEAVPAEVLSSALFTRFRSRQDHTFAERILSAMRHEFGGHQEPGTMTKG